MGMALIMEFHNWTIDQYEAGFAALDLEKNPALGQIFHVAGPFDDGARVVDVWDSQASWEAFQRDRLRPVMERLNVPPPAVTAWQVHNAQSTG